MKTKSTTPKTIKKLFVWSVLIVWLSQIVQTIALAAMQYPHNQNLSGFVPWFLMSLGVPLVITALVYFSRTNRKLSLQSVFEVSAVTMAALFLFIALTTLQIVVPPPMTMDGNSTMYYALYTALPLAVVVVFVGVVLWRLRRSGQW